MMLVKTFGIDSPWSEGSHLVKVFSEGNKRWPVLIPQQDVYLVSMKDRGQPRVDVYERSV